MDGDFLLQAYPSPISSTAHPPISLTLHACAIPDNGSAHGRWSIAVESELRGEGCSGVVPSRKNPATAGPVKRHVARGVLTDDIHRWLPRLDELWLEKTRHLW